MTCESFPTHPIVVNRQMLALANMSWGVVPIFVDDPKQRQIQRRNYVNARSERVIEDKRSYWYKLRKNRCLIPATGIYEHRKVQGFKNKIPYHVSLVGREQFYVPALYQVSQEVDHSTGEIYSFASFAMLTRGANEKMSWIHNDGDNKHRMPLFLTKEMEQAWVLDDLSDDDIDEIFHYSIPSDQIKHYPVFSIRGGKAQPEGKERDAFYDWGGKLPVYDQDEPPQVQSNLF
ncbi:SOS response-associated peptidase [Mucilaginibacter sp. P25]|uniref:SOS response-associated peptidase n=1 Tax=Mucilaginibacter sp. P25 TaxID=3423945 RepID=UPI003D79748A